MSLFCSLYKWYIIKAKRWLSINTRALKYLTQFTCFFPDCSTVQLALSAVDHGFETWSGQTKDYKIGICCFSAKHATLRRKSKDWLARNQNNMSEWSDMSIRGLLFQWASTINIQLSLLVYYKVDLISSFKINLFSPWVCV